MNTEALQHFNTATLQHFNTAEPKDNIDAATGSRAAFWFFGHRTRARRASRRVPYVEDVGFVTVVFPEHPLVPFVVPWSDDEYRHKGAGEEAA